MLTHPLTIDALRHRALHIVFSDLDGILRHEIELIILALIRISLHLHISEGGERGLVGCLVDRRALEIFHTFITACAINLWHLIVI